METYVQMGFIAIVTLFLIEFIIVISQTNGFTAFLLVMTYLLACILIITIKSNGDEKLEKKAEIKSKEIDLIKLQAQGNYTVKEADRLIRRLEELKGR